MALRQNLRSLFRNVSVEEYAALATAARERQNRNHDDRSDYPVPQEANNSIPGAILWSSFVVWQDRPEFVAAAIAAGLISTGCSLYRLLI